MRTAYLKTLFHLAKKDRNVLALISDNGAIVYDEFRKDLPDQYFNFGISEANMLGAAAGLANCGKIPFAYTIGAFMAYRALEFIRNDICLQNLNVKIIGTGAGMAYSALGPTHHATEDIGALRSLPNLVVSTPASPKEVEKAVQAAYEWKGPVYLRIGTNREQEIYDGEQDFQFGKGVELRQGSDITFIGMGNILADILKAADELEQQEISVRVINIHTIKPFDNRIIEKAARETKGIITVEDHNVIGGLGSAAAEALALSGTGASFRRLGLQDHFAKEYGSYEEIKKINGIGLEQITNTVMEMLRG